MRVLNLSLIDYLSALEIQQSIVEKKVSGEYPDVLIFLEHPPAITIGTRGNPSDILVSSDYLAKSGISLYRSDRGGELTFHCPGQLVCYPIMDLRRLNLSVREYVYRLEETIIRSLAVFGVHAFRREGKVGVWTGTNEKIASIGIRIRRRVTFHGFSLNIAMKMRPEELIISCGMADARAANLIDLIGPISVDKMASVVQTCFCSVYGIESDSVKNEVTVLRDS